MSDYGADENPNIPAAQDLAWTKRFMPFVKANVMQWSYGGIKVVRKLAHRLTGSNVLFKFDEPPPPPVIPPDLPPVPAGDACNTCWGNGKPFGVGETPESITVVIQDVKKGPDWMAADGEPPDGTFELSQLSEFPCFFQGITASLVMTLLWDIGGSAMGVVNLPSGTPSFFGFGVECKTVFNNSLNAEFTNGTVTVFIPTIS